MPKSRGGREGEGMHSVMVLDIFLRPRPSCRAEEVERSQQVSSRTSDFCITRPVSGGERDLPPAATSASIWLRLCGNLMSLFISVSPFYP